MVTYRDTKGNAVELPKLTLGISDKMDEVSAAQSNRERYRLQYEFVKEVCGEEYAPRRSTERTVEDIGPRGAERRVRGHRERIRARRPRPDEGIAEQMKALKPVIGAVDAVGKVAVMGQLAPRLQGRAIGDDRLVRASTA
jgi:hypothetical protein